MTKTTRFIDSSCKILDNLFEGCQIISPDWRYLYVNNAVANQGRSPRNQLLGLTMMEVYPGIEDTPMFFKLQQCMQDRKPRQMENEFTFPDGSTGWFELRFTPIPEGVFVLSLDITERKRTEEALRQNESRLKECQEIAHVGQWELDLKTNSLYWSDEIYNMFGMTSEGFKATYESFMETVHPDDREMVNQAYTTSLKERAPYNIIHRLLLRDGTIKFVTETCRTEYDPDGTPLRSIGTVQDITKLKQTENKLRQTLETLEQQVKERTSDLYKVNIELQNEIGERKRVALALQESSMWLSRMFHSLEEAVLIVTPDRTLIDVNKATEKIFGYSREELEAHSTEILHVDRAHYLEFGRRIEEAFTEDKMAVFEFQARRKNGEVFPSAHNVSFLKKDDGTPLGIISVIRDISREKEAEKKLRMHRDELEQLVKERTHRLEHEMAEREKIAEHSKKLALAVEESPVSVIITDKRGRIEYVNRKFCELTQYDFSEVISRNPRILNSGRHDRQFYENFWKTILSGKEWYGEICNKKKDGSLFWERASIGSLKNAQGKITHFVGVKEDITATKEMVQRLEEAHRAAEKANEAKSVFLASMSHELRTPMNSILGFSQLLNSDKRDPPTSHQKRHLQKIIQSSDHLLSLINDVLDLAKIESGGLEMTLEPVNVYPVLSDAVELVRQMAKSRNIQLLLDDPVKNLYIEADRVRLRQVILNLLSNAIKYNKPEGRVSLSCQASTTQVRLTVADTGLGIDKNKIDRLFEPFDRLGAETSSTEGTGVGLTITKRLVESMGGHISVESKPDEGTKFQIDFPLGEAPVEHEDAFVEQKENGVATIKGDYTLLYIEDNLFNRELLAAILDRTPNVQLLTAETAETGINMAIEHKPALILMDLNLPEMDGYAALGKLRELQETQDVPVIAISGDAMPFQIKKALDAGFAEYLTKPFNIEELYRIIGTVLDR